MGDLADHCRIGRRWTARPARRKPRCAGSGRNRLWRAPASGACRSGGQCAGAGMAGAFRYRTADRAAGTAGGGAGLWRSVLVRGGRHAGRRAGARRMARAARAGVFSLAAARLGWRLEDTPCTGLHAAPFARLRPHLARGCRVLVTLRDGAAVDVLAEWLAAQGLGAMRIAVLERLGGPAERIRRMTACDPRPTISPPVAVAARRRRSSRRDRPAARLWPALTTPSPMTARSAKRAIRAVTLSALAPRPGAVGYRRGLGLGQRGMVPERRSRHLHRAARRPHREYRRQYRPLRSVGPDAGGAGRGPGALAGLPAPDAIFVGGGADADLIPALPPARLVINAVTLETEALLTASAEHGGRLMRLSIEEAAPLAGCAAGPPPARSRNGAGHEGRGHRLSPRCQPCHALADALNAPAPPMHAGHHPGQGRRAGPAGIVRANRPARSHGRGRGRHHPHAIAAHHGPARHRIAGRGRRAGRAGPRRAS